MEQVEVAGEVSSILEELDELIDLHASAGADGIRRAVASLVLRYQLTERQLIGSYLERHFPTDGRLRIAIRNVESGAHTR